MTDKLDDLFARDRALADEPARHRAIVDGALRRIRNRAGTGREADWGWLFSKPMGALLAGTLLAGWIAGYALNPPAPEGREVSAVAALLGSGEVM